VTVGERRRVRWDRGELRDILTATAALAGLLVYVYLVGWIVELVRFGAARLPAGPATAALGNRQLFGIGLISTLLMAAVFAVGCAVAYFSSARNWDVRGQDWHDIVRKRGVGNAAADKEAAQERRRRERRHATTIVQRADAVAARSRRRRLAPLAWVAGRVRARNAPKTEGGPPGDPKPLEPAPLGDPAVRVIAGFNIMVLSALIALGVARAVGGAIPIAPWVGVVVGVIVFLLVRFFLTRFSPLVLDSRIHGVIWGVVALGTLFASAPIGVIVLTSMGVATFGRALGRVQQPQSVAQFLRTPLPWVLLTICMLLGLAYSATPPISFSRVTVTTANGASKGGYVARTSAGVYLVTCTPLADATSTNQRLEFVPVHDVENMRIGGGTDYLDSGQRPSIATLALHALGIAGSTPTLFSAALRATEPTCAGGEPISVTPGSEDPALGSGVIAGPAPAAGRASDGEAPIYDTSPAVIAALARRYQPTILVTVADRNWPVSVSAVLAERGPSDQPSCLIQQRAPQRVCPATAATLAGPDSQSYDYLQLPVALADNQRPSGQFQAFLRGQDISSGSLHHWLANPGVLDPWQSAEIYFYYANGISTSKWPAQARNPNVPSGLIGLEYWFYYPFNYDPLVVNSGLMDGAPLAGDKENVDLHQGDWEHIDVLLEPRTLQPAWLYLARHGHEGVFLPWADPQLQFDQGHPVIQASFGSHPSYLPGCGGRPRPITYNVSDDWLSCGSGRFAFRAATTPLVDIAQTPWACWPGYFGEATSLEVQNAKTSETLIDSVKHFVFVAGPRSPLQQAENTGVCKVNPKTAEQAEASAPPLSQR
jgi:hypothetical protein